LCIAASIYNGNRQSPKNRTFGLLFMYKLLVYDIQPPPGGWGHLFYGCCLSSYSGSQEDHLSLSDCEGGHADCFHVHLIILS
jgi:hypothetical protein